MKDDHDAVGCEAGARRPISGCLTRRTFLSIGSAAATTVTLGSLFPGRVQGASDNDLVTVIAADRLKVAKLSALKVDQPELISYPAGQPYGDGWVVRLGKRAGGGIGPDQDVVAFHTWCTHMGGDMSDEYNAEFKVAGPCREHLTTFDLTRHGMVVAGHATESLPQILLELEGDDIWATGVIGLMYGHNVNPPSVSAEGNAS